MVETIWYNCLKEENVPTPIHTEGKSYKLILNSTSVATNDPVSI